MRLFSTSGWITPATFGSLATMIFGLLAGGVP
jgi:hypothetical protein